MVHFNREMEKRHGGISEAKTTQSVGCKNMMHWGSGVLFSVCVCIYGLKGHMNKHKKFHMQRHLMKLVETYNSTFLMKTLCDSETDNYCISHRVRHNSTYILEDVTTFFSPFLSSFQLNHTT